MQNFWEIFILVCEIIFVITFFVCVRLLLSSRRKLRQTEKLCDHWAGLCGEKEEDLKKNLSETRKLSEKNRELLADIAVEKDINEDLKKNINQDTKTITKLKRHLEYKQSDISALETQIQNLMNKKIKVDPKYEDEISELKMVIKKMGESRNSNGEYRRRQSLDFIKSKYSKESYKKKLTSVVNHVFDGVTK